MAISTASKPHTIAEPPGSLPPTKTSHFLFVRSVSPPQDESVRRAALGVPPSGGSGSAGRGEAVNAELRTRVTFRSWPHRLQVWCSSCVGRPDAQARAQGRTSLVLKLREGAFCFGRERVLKAGDQGLIKHFARFGLLSALELRHSQTKKRIGAERPFPSAFL